MLKWIKRSVHFQAFYEMNREWIAKSLNQTLKERQIYSHIIDLTVTGLNGVHVPVKEKETVESNCWVKIFCNVSLPFGTLTCLLLYLRHSWLWVLTFALFLYSSYCLISMPMFVYLDFPSHTCSPHINFGVMGCDFTSTSPLSAITVQWWQAPCAKRTHTSIKDYLMDLEQIKNLEHQESASMFTMWKPWTLWTRWTDGNRKGSPKPRGKNTDSVYCGAPEYQFNQCLVCRMNRTDPLQKVSTT